MTASTSVLATIAGRDRPGLTAAFLAALSAHDVDVRDIEQGVIGGRLVLSVLLDSHGEVAGLRHSAQSAAEALGLECDVEVVPPAPRSDLTDEQHRSHVIVIGRPLRAGALSHVAQRLADTGANIDSITQLSTEPASSVEMLVGGRDEHTLRAALVQAADETGLDIAVEPAGLRRRAKRLVVLDCDSTLVRGEAIDELARRAGVGDEVARITARAMAGELDFEQSLRSRVALLAGLSQAQVDAARDAMELTPGARTFVRTLKRLGYHVGVVSGGFTVVTDRFVTELDLDFSAANQLEVRDGRLTGGLVGPIVDRAAKADALRAFADRFNVPIEQTIAVGDGANDIDMIEAAGLGIAFNAKAALRAAADASLSVPYLDTVLFVLGIRSSDIT